MIVVIAVTVAGLLRPTMPILPATAREMRHIAPRRRVPAAMDWAILRAIAGRIAAKMVAGALVPLVIVATAAIVKEPVSAPIAIIDRPVKAIIIAIISPRFPAGIADTNTNTNAAAITVHTAAQAQNRRHASANQRPFHKRIRAHLIP